MASVEFGLVDSDEQVMQFFDQNIEAWVNETLIEETKNVARAANMSENYINKIKFIKTGFAKGKVVNTHEVWRILEWGSKAHKIRTKGGPQARSPPRVLKFKGRSGAISADIFTPEVDHPGTRPMLIMTKGKEIGFPLFKARVKTELDAFREAAA